jgi:hypothetical protein
MWAIPASWEMEIGRIMVQGQPAKILRRPHLNKQARHGGTYLQSQFMGSLGRSIVIQGFKQKV